MSTWMPPSALAPGMSITRLSCLHLLQAYRRACVTFKTLMAVHHAAGVSMEPVTTSSHCQSPRSSLTTCAPSRRQMVSL
jgi:hypothetical protein